MRIYSKRAGENRLFHFARSEIDSYVFYKGPMYSAGMEIQENIVKVAKQIFSK